MMKAIQIRYLAPTDTKGSRFKAFTEAGSMTAPYDYALDHEHNALALAEAYCKKYAWDRPTGFGSLPNGDYVATLEVLK